MAQVGSEELRVKNLNYLYSEKAVNAYKLQYKLKFFTLHFSLLTGACETWCNTIFQKVFNAEYYTFGVLSALNNCISIRLLWCNTPESITPVLHQIAQNGVILSRVLHRI